MRLEAGGTRAFILKCLRGGQLPGSESESVMAPVTGNPSLIPAIYTAEDRSVTLSLFPLSSRTDVFCLPAVQPSGLNCPFNARDLTACLGKFSSAFVRLTLNIYMTGPFSMNHAQYSVHYGRAFWRANILCLQGLRQILWKLMKKKKGWRTFMATSFSVFSLSFQSQFTFPLPPVAIPEHGFIFSLLLQYKYNMLYWGTKNVSGPDWS